MEQEILLQKSTSVDLQNLPSIIKRRVVNFQPAVKFVINKSKRKSFGMSSPVKVFEGNACSKDLHRNYLESVNKCS